MSTPQHRRSDYAHFQAITPRWQDNDLYGHVHHVACQSHFDTAVNTYLIEEGGLDIHAGDLIGFVVSASCDYFAAITFPERLKVGLKVGKLGTHSVQFELALFKAGEDEACAAGRLVQIFLQRAGNQPATIPDQLRAALSRLLRH
jgi:acyl-CoA thioester hydrolase